MVCLTLHVREGVKKHNIHIKLKSYKFEFLGELVMMGSIPIIFSLRHTSCLLNFFFVHVLCMKTQLSSPLLFFFSPINK